MEKARVAVIGCGFFGRMHAEVYTKLPNVELVAICDLLEERAKEIAATLRTVSYTDYNEILLRNDIDAVDICVPDDSHTEVALKAIQAKKHILVEKPLADSVENARQIYDAAKEYEQKFMVAHILRFDPRIVKAYEIIKNGDLGKIIYVSSRRKSPISGARHYARHCELITHSGVHDIDLVRWFVGSEYKTVYAKSRSERLKEENLNVHDAILALFTFDNGVIYSLENCWVLPERYPSYIDAKVEVVGTKGFLYIDFFDHGLRVYNIEGADHPDLIHWPELMGERLGDLREELIHFVNCILNDEKPRVSLKDGYEAAIAAVKVLESIEKNQEVSIS